MRLWKSVSGIIKVEITTASSADLLTAIHRSGLQFMNATMRNDLVLTGEIFRQDYMSFKTLLESRGDKLERIERAGIFWVLKNLRRRPVLISGLCLLFAFAFFIPTRILFVRVEGNITTPNQLIIDNAAELGVHIGASRKVVRSEHIKNGLLERISSLQWACVNTKGCVAIITVKERAVQSDAKTSNFGAIVAKRDAIIESVTVSKGNPLCFAGQAVLENQVLVSGYTDCGIIIKTTRPSAEIIGKTYYNLDVVTPIVYDHRGEKMQIDAQFSLKVGKKLIKLSNCSGISGTGCVKMYEEYPLRLPGGLELPIALVRETYSYYSMTNSLPINPIELNWLPQQSDQYLLSHMVAGEIITAKCNTQLLDSCCYLRGEYICREMIGTFRSEETIRTNEQRD